MEDDLESSTSPTEHDRSILDMEVTDEANQDDDSGKCLTLETNDHSDITKFLMSSPSGVLGNICI